jgi:hypothetical protein
MNTMGIGDLIRFGRSWAYAPVLNLRGNRFTSVGYEKSERCYRIENTSGKSGALEFTLEATENAPAVNPAFFIKSWNSSNAQVLVNGKPCKECRIGIYQELDGVDLVVFMALDSNKSIRVTILPR